MEEAPEFFEYRLGLSATPEKQYDEIITKQMFEYFGPIIYKYQLADAIGGQTQTPTRAYVVSSDVTSAQELDRNIVEGASIG